MQDIDLIVPYKEDGPIRARNKKIFLDYWKDFKITLVEDYETRAGAYNTAAKNSTSQFIALADIDVTIPYEQMHVPEGADVVYPFSYAVNVFHEETLREDRFYWGDYFTYGLMILFDRQKFLEFGGENENFKGWGWEDLERYFRALNYGYKIIRNPGPVYHNDHGSGHRRENPDLEYNYTLMSKEREKFERTRGWFNSYERRFIK